jgi:hypothetical protein
MITFKAFLEDSRGFHGEYSNDIPERTMVNYIIRLVLNNVRDEKNYSQVYSFIESDLFEPFYDKYYDAFEEKAKSGKSAALGKGGELNGQTKELLNRFSAEMPGLFKEWKSKAQKE